MKVQLNFTFSIKGPLNVCNQIKRWKFHESTYILT